MRIKVLDEGFYDVDNLEERNCKGYAVQLYNMDSAYTYLLCFNDTHISLEKNRLRAEDIYEDINSIIQRSEDFTTDAEWDEYQIELDNAFYNADKVIDEIDTRRDIDYYKENGKKVYVYGNDDKYYIIYNDVALPVYF